MFSVPLRNFPALTFIIFFFLFQKKNGINWGGPTPLPTPQDTLGEAVYKRLVSLEGVEGALVSKIYPLSLSLSLNPFTVLHKKNSPPFLKNGILIKKIHFVLFPFFSLFSLFFSSQLKPFLIMMQTERKGVGVTNLSGQRGSVRRSAQRRSISQEQGRGAPPPSPSRRMRQGNACAALSATTSALATSSNSLFKTPPSLCITEGRSPTVQSATHNQPSSIHTDVPWKRKNILARRTVTASQPTPNDATAITSTSEALRTSTVWQAKEGAGMVSLSVCPGKKIQKGRNGKSYARSLRADLLSAKERVALTQIICLLNPSELRTLGVQPVEYSAVTDHLGILLVPYPMIEMAAPKDCTSFDQDIIVPVCEELKRGGSILAHCRGGVGRAGMFYCDYKVVFLGYFVCLSHSGLLACCVILRLGEACSAEEAITLIRSRRDPRAVESQIQMNFVKKFAAYLQALPEDVRTATHLTCSLTSSCLQGSLKEVLPGVNFNAAARRSSSAAASKKAPPVNAPSMSQSCSELPRRGSVRRERSAAPPSPKVRVKQSIHKADPQVKPLERSVRQSNVAPPSKTRTPKSTPPSSPPGQSQQFCSPKKGGRGVGAFRNGLGREKGCTVGSGVGRVVSPKSDGGSSVHVVNGNGNADRVGTQTAQPAAQPRSMSKSSEYPLIELDTESEATQSPPCVVPKETEGNAERRLSTSKSPSPAGMISIDSDSDETSESPSARRSCSLAYTMS